MGRPTARSRARSPASPEARAPPGSGRKREQAPLAWRDGRLRSLTPIRSLLLVPNHDAHVLARARPAVLHLVHHLAHDGEAQTPLALLGDELVEVELRDRHRIESLAFVEDDDVEALALGMEMNLDLVAGLAAAGVLNDVGRSFVDG